LLTTTTKQTNNKIVEAAKPTAADKSIVINKPIDQRF